MFMMQVAIRVELKGNTEVDNEENQPTDPLGMPSKHPLTLKTHTYSFSYPTHPPLLHINSPSHQTSRLINPSIRNSPIRSPTRPEI